MIRRGMTLIEVMIALGILSVVILGMVGNLVALNNAHRAAKETATAQQIAQSLVERFQGASWYLIGHENWSRHRRNRPGATYPPITETTAVAADNLQALGLLSTASGLQGLQVYVELYTMGLFQDGNAVWQVGSPATYRARLTDPTLWLPENDVALDLREVNDAIVIRILVRWTDTMGANRVHELVFARRK